MTATVQQSTSTCYTIRNNGEWARIFLIGDQRTANDGGYWGTIAVESSFGSWGHTFGSMSSPLENFLQGVDMHYLMGKFMGSELDQFDADATSLAMRKEICRLRRENEEDPETLRDLYDTVVSMDDHQCKNENAYSLLFMEKLSGDAHALFHNHEFWEHCATRINPQAEGFWLEIWPAFVSYLRLMVAG